MPIPSELTAFRQWVVWRYETRPGAAKPTKVPYSVGTGFKASVTDPHDWSTFREACDGLAGFDGLGFVLTAADPYVFIDLDATDDATERQLHRAIFENFGTYAERSPSGKGLHLIARGMLPTGRRRHAVELYSTERYMTMTGDVVKDLPIADVGAHLTGLYAYLAPPREHVVNTIDEPDRVDDATVMRWAYQTRSGDTRANGEKFRELWVGEWEKHYSSQSEADFALINIIAHYTNSRSQVRRMFHASALGKRDKAHRGSYLNRMVEASFDRKEVEVTPDFSALEAQIAAFVHGVEPEPPKVEELPPAGVPKVPTQKKPTAEIERRYSYPPGIVSDVAEFIFAASPRPLGEVALVGSLALLAGIAGRAYNVGGQGLNQYFFLVGPTGVGKDSAQLGMAKLLPLIVKVIPAADTFFGPGEIASPQALYKHLAENPCFVSYSGEIGHLLQQMSSPHATGPHHGLKRLLLQLYTLSGHEKTLGEMIYSAKEKNTKRILSPAFTWMGETTPGKFYPNLDEVMISEGLIPRFFTVETQKKRPPLNRDHKRAKPSEALVARLAEIAQHAVTLNASNSVVDVDFEPEAQAIFDQFDQFCDDKINVDDRDVRRELWSRAGLKALKLAGLVAVGMNYIRPTITVDVAKWSIQMMVQDVRNMLSRFDTGEIVMGDVEAQQIQKIVETIREWYLSPWSNVARYAGAAGERMHGNRLVPYAFIQRKNINVAAFNRDKRGATEAIRRALRVLIERGDLQEVARHHVAETYGSTATVYVATNLNAFGLG